MIDLHKCHTNHQLETKASSHEGQCIPAGYWHAHYAAIREWS